MQIQDLRLKTSSEYLKKKKKRKGKPYSRKAVEKINRSMDRFYQEI